MKNKHYQMLLDFQLDKILG